MSVLVKAVGVSTFIGLEDTPASYTDQAAKQARVNAGEDAMELTTEESGLELIIEGSGAAITTGIKGYLEVPFNCYIDVVELLADQLGSIKIDIWKDTYANFPPLDGDTITGANEPEIDGATKYQDSTLTGWTRALTKGDVLAFNVDSCTDIERVTVTLKVVKT